MGYTLNGGVKDNNASNNDDSESESGSESENRKGRVVNVNEFISGKL